MPGGAPHSQASGTAERPAGALKGALRRVLLNSARLLGGKSVSAVFGLGYVALAARGLGLEGYGTLILIHTFTAVVSRIFSFKSWQTLLRYGTPPLQRGDGSALRRLVRFTAMLDAGAATLAAVVAASGAWLVGPLLGWPPAVTPLASAYAIAALFMITTTPIGLLRLFDRFDLLAVQTTIQSAIRLAGAALAWSLEWGLAAFLAIWFGARVVATAALVAWSWRELRRRAQGGPAPGWPRPAAEFPGIWRFAWITNLTGTLGLTFQQMGALVVGALLGATEAGLYHVADRLARTVVKPARLLRPTVYPELAQLLASGATARMRRLMFRMLGLCAALALVMLPALLLAGEPLLVLLGGDAARPAYGVMGLLAGAGLLRLAGTPLGPLLVSAGRPGLALRAQLASTAAYLLTVAPLVDALGLAGAGAAALLAVLVGLLLQAIGVVPWLRRPAAEGDRAGR